MDEDDRYEAGLDVRKKVLGERHVERSLAGRTPFNEEFQALITRYAWGEIWTRPGFDHRTRRLLVLAITASMGRWEEFRLHIRAGLEDGLTADDIKELLLQTAIYAGVPAANTGFHIAAEIMTELGKDLGSGGETPPP
jgi:4-carboxymuconolactone decarboxylase